MLVLLQARSDSTGPPKRSDGKSSSNGTDKKSDDKKRERTSSASADDKKEESSMCFFSPVCYNFMLILVMCKLLSL